MKTLEVTIPDEIFGVLSSLTQPKDKFVLEAIREKLAREKKQKIAKENKINAVKESSLKSQKLRPVGLSKEKFVVPEDFDSLLPEEILADFEY